jgi:hypothetical protein
VTAQSFNVYWDGYNPQTIDRSRGSIEVEHQGRVLLSFRLPDELRRP